MSFPGYFFAVTSQAAVTPATESTRVPSMSNKLFRYVSKRATSMNPGAKHGYPHIASKVMVVVGILKNDWDSECSVLSSPSFMYIHPIGSRKFASGEIIRRSFSDPSPTVISKIKSACLRADHSTPKRTSTSTSSKSISWTSPRLLKTSNSSVQSSNRSMPTDSRKPTSGPFKAS